MVIKEIQGRFVYFISGSEILFLLSCSGQGLFLNWVNFLAKRSRLPHNFILYYFVLFMGLGGGDIAFFRIITI